MDVDEHVVAVSPGRDSHAMVVQVRGRIRQVVLEGNPQPVADPGSEHRRHIGTIVKTAPKFEVAELHTAASSSKGRAQDAVLAADFRGRRQCLQRACLRGFEWQQAATDIGGSERPARLPDERATIEPCLALECGSGRHCPVSFSRLACPCTRGSRQNRAPMHRFPLPVQMLPIETWAGGKPALAERLPAC
jgi:hypothetical protein